MSLYEKLGNDLKEAMRGRSAIKLSAIRMLMAAIKNAEITRNVKELEDGDIYQIIRKEINKRKDSVEQFQKGGRTDLADKESEEQAILEAYMPKEMSREELARIVDEAIKASGAATRKDTGKVMKAVMEKTKGMADGKAVNQLVMERLK